jgi:hypothetical protein
VKWEADHFLELFAQIRDDELFRECSSDAFFALEKRVLELEIARDRAA